ncbi:hypothetical protein QS468_50670, partial [Bacillus subtilis]|nr:hypothetical protein [Bacillus subtilis]
MANEEQPRDHVVVSTDGLRVYDTGGYEAEIGLDGSVVFKDKHGNIFEPSLDGSSVTYFSGNSTIKVETDGKVTLHTERGPGETTIVSRIGADGKASIERATISGTPLSLGKRVMVVSVGVKLEWTPQDGWSLDGELQIFGMTLPEIADTAYAAVENSGVGQLLGSRDEYTDAFVNGETTDSYIVWVRKRNQAQVKAETNQHFNEANAFVERRDPLSLDLDGDGIETVGTNAGITFDFDGDGLKTGTGWVKGDDGFLVLDRNGNGQIDNGGELFGVDTVKANGQKATDGFDALKDFDSNGDGVFDAQDTQFANVKIWQDANQDGIAQAGELKTLAEHNIVAINLDSTASNHNSNGNLISAVGSFVRGDGSEGTVNANQSLAANLDLASNPFYREFTDHIALDDTAKALPDMKGSGAVRDLREASMLNAELKTLLATYSQAQTREEQMGLLDQLIAEWAKSADYQTFDERIDALDDGTTDVRFQYSWEANGIQPTEAQQNTRKLLERVKALEVFNAQNILKFGKVGSDTNSLTLSFGIGASTGNSTYSTSQGVVVINESRLSFNAAQINLLDQAYEKLKQSIFDGLALQTVLKPYIELVDINLTSSGLELDYSKAFTLFNSTATKNPLKAVSDALDFTRIWKDKSATDSVLSNLLPGLVEQLSIKDLQHVKNLYTNTGLHLQFGDSSGNSLAGTSSSDIIFALAGNDTVTGNGGNDTLIGGSGNDSLTAYNG